MVSRKSPLMRPLAKNATRPSSSKPSSRSAALAVSMLPEMVLYAAVPSAMPTRIQSRAAGASHTLYSSLWRSLKRRRTIALPRRRRGLELDQREAAFAHFDLRLARAVGEDLVVVELLDFPPGAVRRIDAEGRDRAGARRLAVLVEHAQRDHRARAAVGDELRSRLVDLGAHRAAAEVHRALAAPDYVAVLRRARAPTARCRRRRGRRARQRLSATVFASLQRRRRRSSAVRPACR